MTFNYKSFVEDLASRGFVIGDSIVGYEINPYFEMPRSLDYTEVAIHQQMNQCESRLDADIRSEVFRGVWLDSPMIASNMSSVTNSSFCILLRKLGVLGILHRGFSNEDSYLVETKKIAEQCDLVAVSVGVGQSQVELASKLFWAGANVINIDVAHGFSEIMIKTAAAIKKNHPSIKLVVGNTNNEQFLYMVDKVADAVKIQLGTGAACTTRYTAGAFERPWTVARRFRKVSKKLGLPVINDGGISEPASFVKAIGAGVSSCMMGSAFARCPESAADLVYENGVPKKLYFGMASLESQLRWKGGLKNGTCAEGRSVLLDLGETAQKLIERYSGALRSGITYAGARNVCEFQDKVKFVRL